MQYFKVVKTLKNLVQKSRIFGENFKSLAQKMAGLLDQVRKRTYHHHPSTTISPSDYIVHTRAKAQSAEFGQKLLATFSGQVL